MSDKAKDVYIYVPNLASESGWSAHKVERDDLERRPVGFTPREEALKGLAHLRNRGNVEPTTD